MVFDFGGLVRRFETPAGFEPAISTLGRGMTLRFAGFAARCHRRCHLVVRLGACAKGIEFWFSEPRAKLVVCPQIAELPLLENGP